MLRLDLCDFNEACIIVTGNITVVKKISTADDFEAPNNTTDNATATNNANDNTFGKKSWFLKKILYLLIAFQKLMI